MGARGLAMVIAAYALLGVSWAITNPPFASPDESAHYLRAMGFADGAVGDPARDPNPALTPKQRAWSNQAARKVAVPAGLSPGGPAPCMSGDPARSAACLDGQRPNATAETEVTSVGTYQPLPYLLPAIVVRQADSAADADRLARLATLAVWLALLGVAAWLLWDGGAASLAGLMVAITPQVVFVGASLTGSSLEIAASVAFVAALLRIAREPAHVPRVAWVVVGAAGAALALSRSPGPVWVAIDVGLCLAFIGRRRLKVAIYRSEGWAAAATAVVATAVITNLAWESRYGPSIDLSLVPGWESLKAGRRQLTHVLDDVVGNFGYLDTPLGWVGVTVWALLAAALVVTAARTARRRERWAVAIAAGVFLLAPIYLFAAATSATGFGLQARHVLAIIVVLPLLAGEAARERLSVVPLAVGVAGVQLLAWWTNSRRYAVGDGGSWWFFGDAQWSPPGGWWLWLAVTCAAAAALAVSPAFSARRS